MIIELIRLSVYVPQLEYKSYSNIKVKVYCGTPFLSVFILF